MVQFHVPFCAQLRLCAVFFAVWIPVQAEVPFDALWAQAEEQNLWNDPEWWTLGHYHRTMWGTVTSRMDDPRFFLHPKGKQNRRLELQATLEAFIDPDSVPGELSVACRFPARRKWLLEKLELPEETFPGGDCPEYHEVLSQLNIKSATLIYPAAYLNSPASMFGHLLLVLDLEGKDRLLSRAVNYAANVQDSFGPLFAVKGIFGFYSGVYSMMPYYDKVEEYAAVSRRDIWEYPLELTPDELDMLLRHVWELQELQSRYFFFKENCAFNLLYPIQVARPSLEIVRRFRMSAVPVSLLQQLRRTGVTGDPVFRPSKASEMTHFAEKLSDDEIREVRDLVEGQPPRGNESPDVLVLAISWLQYIYTEQEISPKEYRERLLPLLGARSKLGKVKTDPPPAPVSPDQGHAPRRFSVYGGVDTVRGEAVTGVKLRAAYHDWLDDPVGYPSGSSIRMIEVDVQGRPETGEVYLNDITLVDIRSHTPPEPWVRPLSWSVSFGGDADPFDPEHMRGFVRSSSGITRRAGEKGQVYFMITQQFLWDTNFEDNVSWEPGFEWGGLVATPRFSCGVRGLHTWGVLGFSDSRHRVEAEGRFFVSRNLSLGCSVIYRHEEGDEQNLVLANLNRTF